MNKRSALSIGIFGLTLLFVGPSFANDSAAAIAAGGIQFRQERNVSLEKENLYISQNNVTVEYTFKNNSRRAVKTQVAFPVPPFGWHPENDTEPAVTDFSVAVNGRQVRFKSEIKAMVRGTDVTDVLQKHNIPIRDFDAAIVQIGQLDQATRTTLVASGVISSFDAPYAPEWSVHMLYYWEQTFPANSLTRIRHSYTPHTGGSYAYFASSSTLSDQQRSLGVTCLDKSAEDWLQGRRPSSSGSKTKDRIQVISQWVHYILVTANNWQGPIMDFTLTVQPPTNGIVLLCADGINTSQHFEVHRKNYRPKEDLIVYFLTSN